MNGIEFTADFGGGQQPVKVYSPCGSGGEYFILVGNYYNGQMWQRDGSWVAYLASRSELQTEDICILGEMLDQQLKLTA